jgi:hypothetical protein
MVRGRVVTADALKAVAELRLLVLKTVGVRWSAWFIEEITGQRWCNRDTTSTWFEVGS